MKKLVLLLSYISVRSRYRFLLEKIPKAGLRRGTWQWNWVGSSVALRGGRDGTPRALLLPPAPSLPPHVSRGPVSLPHLISTQAAGRGSAEDSPPPQPHTHFQGSHTVFLLPLSWLSPHCRPTPSCSRVWEGRGASGPGGRQPSCILGICHQGDRAAWVLPHDPSSLPQVPCSRSARQVHLRSQSPRSAQVVLQISRPSPSAIRETTAQLLSLCVCVSVPVHGVFLIY